MNKLRLLVVATLLLFTVPAAAEWSVVDARWRPDDNAFAKQQVWDGWRWSEGWRNEEQYYPKHFHPSGSIHVILRNNTEETETFALTHIDDAPVQDIETTPKKAGRIIWYRLDCPQLPTTQATDERVRLKERTIPPGEWVECGVRFRQRPTGSVRLRFAIGSREMEIPVAIEQPRVRLEAIAFSPQIDRLYVYIRSLDGTRARTGGMLLDGRDASSDCRWAEGPKGSGLMLAEVKLSPAWKYGAYHLVEATLSDGHRLVQYVRAWDYHFSIGLFGSAKRENVQAAKEKGFDTYYWDDPTAVYELGLNHIPWNHNYGQGPQRTPGKPGALFNYNMDEPDCHDWTLGGALPPMERLGVYAEHVVLPRFEQQREKDPLTPSMLLVNNSFKPMNYYVYGQMADVFASDPYQLLGLDQIEYVRHVMQAVHDAATPRPTVAVLWVSGFLYNDPCGGSGEHSGDLKVRPPSPQEERMMVFYALGAGAKGLGYFADHTDQEGLVTSEGRYLPLSHNQPLWEEVGRINSDVRALAPYLAVGCAMPLPDEHKKVWASAIMSGPDNLVVILVNKDHYIGYNTCNAHAWHSPAADVNLTIPLPPHFGGCLVREVKDGKLVQMDAAVERGQLRLALDEVDTARAFVVTNTNAE